MTWMLCALGALALQAEEGRPGFRVRSGFGAALNADEGWAGALNENAGVWADEPFRIRFEAAPAAAGPFRLQVRRNEGAWTDLEAHDFPHPVSKKPKTPRASLVSCAAYKNGAPTTDLLRGLAAPFQPGAGVALADRAPSWTGGGAHGEFEWALVVRRFADGAEMNEEGDVFEFRMAAADGSPLPDGPRPRLRLGVRPGHLGGTYVETPGRVGPWKASNGDLYFILEPAETSNRFMMVKSADQGRTWREVDGAHRPPTNDLESVDARLVGDTIHVVHQVTRSVRYHAFRTSDHPTRPDTWAVGGEPAAELKSVAQAATLAVLSDGRVAAFFVGQGKVHGGLRSPDGTWREIAVLPDALGPQCALGAGDEVHLAYYAPAGQVWHRRLLQSGALTEPTLLAEGLGTSRSEYGSVLPLVYLPKAGTAVVVYRGRDGHLWERRVAADGAPAPAVRVSDRPVIHDAVDSQQPAADVVSDGDRLRVLFIDAATRSLYAVHEEAGGWGKPALLVDKILGSWVRGAVYARRDGARVYGFVYDAGSDGGAGMNRFGELLLSPGAGGPRR